MPHAVINLAVMDALGHAERLAHRNPDKSVVIYQKANTASLDESGKSRFETTSDTLYVRLSDDEAPEGAEVLTTVTRRDPALLPTREPTIADVVRFIIGNLPAGVQLHARAVVEHYPKQGRYDPSPDRVFAYQFFSTEMRNVATFIPCMSGDFIGVTMQMGPDGRGRQWSRGNVSPFAGPTYDLGWLLRELHAKGIGPAPLLAETVDGNAARTAPVRSMRP